MDAHKNLSYSTIATAPSPASSGTSLVVQSGDGALFPAVPFNATIWPSGAAAYFTNAEIVRVTGRSTDTLTIVRAQEGTNARSVVVGDQIAATITALTFSDIENPLKYLYPGICQGRLTLASGFPVYAPQPATPGSTNTTTDIVTWNTDPGWVTGTIVTPASTLGGLTAGTRYYYGKLSSTTGAFYTSVANANANTSKVDLTANITQQVNPSGISQTSINFTPVNGDAIGLYDGSAIWALLKFIETNLALGSLVNFQAYDVFGYNNSGTLALEFLEWANAVATMTIATPGVVTWTAHGMTTGQSITFTTSGALPTGVTANTQYFVTVVDANTFKLSTSLANVVSATFIATSGSQSGTHTGHQPQARQTAIVLQDGIPCKSGDTTRRLLGTILADSTTTTIDDAGGLATQTGGKRFVSNAQNLQPLTLNVFDSTSNWTYNTATWRPANNAAANRVDFINSLPTFCDFLLVAGGEAQANGAVYASGIGIDTISATPEYSTGVFIGNAGDNASGNTIRKTANLAAGLHYASWMESGSGTATSKGIGVSGGYRSGLSGFVNL